MIRLSAATAVLALVAACSASDSTDVTTSLDLNAAISQSMLGDINTFGGATATLGIPSTAANPAFDPAKCPFNSLDNSFTCQSVTLNGLSYSLKYFVYDAGGVALTTPDPLRAASVRTLIGVTGTITNGGATGTVATIDHQSDMTLSGLMSATRTLNGTSRDHDLIVTNGVTSTRSTVDLTGTTANLVLPNASSKYPASGTITSVANTATQIGALPQVTTSANAVLTFNGTSTASLVATVSGHVTTCQIDLTGGNSPRCS
jgi:hypothetical protein